LDPLSPAPPRPKATAFQLVFMTYAVICSGAYGLEEMVSASGPGLTMVVLLVLPLVYAAPISLTCAELASRFEPYAGALDYLRRVHFSGLAGPDPIGEFLRKIAALVGRTSHN